MKLNQPSMYQFCMAFFLATAMLVGFGCKKETDDDPEVEEIPITLECSSVFDDMILKNDPNLDVDYIVPCVIDLYAGLSIEAGTVIQFETDAGFAVYSGGFIASNGTQAQPVVMKGVVDQKGVWKGIYVESNDVRNLINHTQIKNGGGESFNSNDDRGSIILYAGGRLTLQNSTISKGSDYGLNVNYYSGVNLTFQNNTITDVGKNPVLIPSSLAHEIDAASSLTGNGADFVKVFSDQLYDEVTWEGLSVPYHIFSNSVAAPTVYVRSGAGITLTGGADLRFDADCGIEVIEGYLKATGSASEKVVLTGLTAAPGAWRGIYIDSNNLNNSLDNVEIAYAGAGAFNSNGDVGSVVVWADAYLSLTNSEIRDGSGCGISAVYNGETLVTTGTVFTNVSPDICQ